MISYATARPGYKYRLTYAGRKIKAVAAKYKEGTNLYKQYQHHVPRTWVTNGYVEEVKEDNDGIKA